MFRNIYHSSAAKEDSSSWLFLPWIFCIWIYLFWDRSLLPNPQFFMVPSPLRAPGMRDFTPALVGLVGQKFSSHRGWSYWKLPFFIEHTLLSCVFINWSIKMKMLTVGESLRALSTLAKHLDLVEKQLSGSTEFFFFIWMFWCHVDPDSVKTWRNKRLQKTHTHTPQNKTPAT